MAFGSSCVDQNTEKCVDDGELGISARDASRSKYIYKPRRDTTTFQAVKLYDVRKSHST